MKTAKYSHCQLATCGLPLTNREKKYHPECFQQKERLRARDRYRKQHPGYQHDCRCGVCGRVMKKGGRPRKESDATIDS